VVWMESKKAKERFSARVSISGAGVLHVRSSDILRTREAKRQLQALKKIKDKGLIGRLAVAG